MTVNERSRFTNVRRNFKLTGLWFFHGKHELTGNFRKNSLIFLNFIPLEDFSVACSEFHGFRYILIVIFPITAEYQFPVK